MVVGDEGYVAVSLLYNILLLAGYDTENLFVAIYDSMLSIQKRPGWLGRDVAASTVAECVFKACGGPVEGIRLHLALLD